MAGRNLVMLTSLRPSSKYRQTVTREEVSAFWHACFSLWHPLVVAEAAGPPVLGSQDEFEVPQVDHLYVLPESPYRYHAPDWAERVQAAGSIHFAATPDWQGTVNNLAQAIQVPCESILIENWMPFAGLGMGYLLLDAYCDAQDHSNPLDVTSFYELVRKAAQTRVRAEQQSLLENAAHHLREAREVVNPSKLYQALTLFFTGNPAEYSLQNWLDSQLPLTCVASANWLLQWTAQFPSQATELKTRLAAGSIDWWGGHFTDSYDALLPLSAWLANLKAGNDVATALGGRQFESSGRSYFAASQGMPAILQSFGIKRSLGFSNDGAIWPKFSNSIAAWRGPDGELLETCGRVPEPIDHDETPFHLAHLIHESSASDYVGWLHFGSRDPVLEVPLWLQCWHALHRLTPVFGHLGTLTQTISDIPATEQYTPVSADDFQTDYLLDLTGHGCLPAAQLSPISRFAIAQRAWRSWEVTKIMTALHAAITTNMEFASDAEWPGKLLISNDSTMLEKMSNCMVDTARQFARRLSRSWTSPIPGYLVFNPCAFARKVPVQLSSCTTLLPSPSVASQKAVTGIDAVIDVPPMGYAWVPLKVATGEKVRVPRQPIIENHSLRNDHLIVEVDPQTGGLRSIKDAARQIPRLGQQLVFAPGSTMRCDEMKVLRNGYAVGEVQSLGKLYDAHDQVLAEYTQTFRLWMGKKYAEIDVHLQPMQKTAGFPWHSCFASRWAWRDTGAQLSKSVFWTRTPVHQNRPETQGFIQLESSTGKIAIFSGGLPFWQRRGARMLDSVLITEAESETDFKFAISLDDELPHVTEQDWLTPALSTQVDRAPPAAAVASWLFHLDAPSVLLFEMTAEKSNKLAITLRLVETFGYATDVLLQCPVRPSSADVINSLGEVQRQLELSEEGVVFRMGCYQFLQIRLHFN